MSTPGHAVHQRVVGLRDQREAAALEPLHDPDLPQRLRAVEPLGEDAPHELAQLVVAAGLRQGGVAHVVVEVEASGRRPRTAGPSRAAGTPASGGSAAPAEARTRGARRTRRARAAAPRRSRARRRACATPASPGARNEASIALRRSLCPCCATRRSLLGTIGSVKLLGIVLAVQVAIGLTLVVLVATDNVPFVGDDAANGSARRPRPRSIASTAPRPSGSCAARWRSARARPARPSRAGSPRLLQARASRAGATRRCPAGFAT